MKKQFSLLTALALGLMLVTPALADSWYEHHDADHDGRWNYNEFRDAHNNWYNGHHQGRVYNDHDLQRQFNNRDRDRDGYVSRQEVQSFHHW